MCTRIQKSEFSDKIKAQIKKYLKNTNAFIVLKLCKWNEDIDSSKKKIYIQAVNLVFQHKI